MDIAGHRPYRLGIIELGLGYLVSSLAIPSADIQSRITVSLTLGTAIGGLLFYVGPFERIILPRGIQRNRIRQHLLSTSYMRDSVAYVVGGWYACLAIVLIAFFPPTQVRTLSPLEFYGLSFTVLVVFRISLAVIIGLVLTASILEFRSIPMKLSLIEHYESLIKDSRDPALLEQTFGAALVRGDFIGDAEVWSRRWTLGEEYIRIRPMLLGAFKILADAHGSILIGDYEDAVPILLRFKVFFVDRIKRTQLDNDFLTGGYSELLQDFQEIAETVGDVEQIVGKNRGALTGRARRLLGSKKLLDLIKGAALEIGQMTEDEMWEDLRR